MAKETVTVGTGDETTGTIEPDPAIIGAPCFGGAEPATLAPIWYIVQPEDLSNFWRIPEKFGLPAKQGQRWRWHELRDANLDWPGGLAKDAYGSCVLQSLHAGAKLAVPGDWPPPKAGTKVEPRKDIPPKTPDKAMGIAGLILLGVGLLGATVLTIAVARSKRRSA